MADTAQKTEKPTPRRIEKARREGNFPSARQLVSAAHFLAFAAILAWGGASWLNGVRVSTRWAFARAFSASLGSAELIKLLVDLLVRTFSPLLLAGAVVIITTLAVQLASTRVGVSLKKVAPDFKRLSPLSKLRELPRQNVPALLQALVMLPLFGAAVYFIARDNFEMYLCLPLKDVATGLRQVAGSMEELLWKASAVFLAFGLVDFARQRRRYQQDLRMSKQEVREEVKELEGDPQIKARIRRLRRELLRRKMMQEIPKATAVIVNPTHYAVAIRYVLNSMAAPVVVARGQNYLAQRIRQKAVEHQVPLVENAPLAQALYKSCEVGQEIPAHLYRAVAEVLAYIYRLMNGRLPC